MNLDNVLSVGYEFDYPLTGGESLYGLLPTFNDKFSLNLTEDNFTNRLAQRRVRDGLVGITAISYDGLEIINFINTTNAGVVVADKSTVNKGNGVIDFIMGAPVNFTRELAFLSSVTPNVPIEYDLKNAKTITNLCNILTSYKYGDWVSVGEGNNIVADFVLRYYGKGDGVPAQYGSFDPSVTVAIVDLLKNGFYIPHCLRSKVYHVYDNGYRSGD